MIKNLLAVCAGTVFEYCETSLLLLYANAIAKVFFPNMSTNVVYMIPLISIIARPLGAYGFGKFADAYGAFASIRCSALLMSIASGIISILPGHDVFGEYAGVFLIILRGLQMASVGGELNFAAIVLLDNMKCKNFASGLVWSATSLGWLLAWSLYSCLGPESWRQAFAITSLIGLLIVPVRGAVSHDSQDIVEVNHPQGELISFLLSASVGAVTYYSLQYRRIFASDEAVWLAYLIAFFANAFFGYMIDLCGSAVILLGVCMSVFALMRPENFLLYPVVLAMWKAPTHAISYNLFTKSRRCSKSAIFYALGTSIAGQGTMLFCTLLDRYAMALLWPMFGLCMFVCAIYLYSRDLR